MSEPTQPETEPTPMQVYQALVVELQRMLLTDLERRGQASMVFDMVGVTLKLQGSLSDHNAMAQLLIRKGIFSEAEYTEAVLLSLKTDLDRLKGELNQGLVLVPG